MPPQPTDFRGEMQDVLVRLSRAETQIKGIEEVFKHYQQSSESFSTKEELRLQLENLRLTIENLKTQVGDMAARMGGLEANIVTKVEAIAKEQQTSQLTSMKRIIAVQSVVLLAVLSAVLGVIIPLLLHH